METLRLQLQRGREGRDTAPGMVPALAAAADGRDARGNQVPPSQRPGGNAGTQG